MSNWMQGLQSILSTVQEDMTEGAATRTYAQQGYAAQQPGDGGQQNTMEGVLGSLLNKDNLSKLLGPAALGGLAGALMGGRGGANNSGGMGKALLLSGGAALGMMALDRYKKQVEQAQAQNPRMSAQQPASPIDERIKRLITAMVFAARADGNMDEGERQAVEQKVKSLSLGPDGERAVQQAMTVPVDPNALAVGVKNADEALETYLVSRSVVNVDQFMERNYLQALAKALNIPESVQQGIEADIAKAA